MLTINKAGQKWFFDNIVIPYLNAKIRRNWDSIKDAWFEDLENCVMNTFIGEDIIYEINKQFTLDKQSFTFRMHDNFIDNYFGQW